MTKPLKAAIAAAVLLVLFMSAQGTAALWRAEEQLEPGTIKTGTLSLAAGNGTDSSQTYVFSELATSTLAPGGFVQAPLTISNTGTADLRYTLSGAITATPTPGAADVALAAAVELSMHSVADAAECGVDMPSPGDALYQGPLGAAAAFAAPRNLAAGVPGSASEIMCVRVALPNNAPQTAAGGTLELQLSFTAEQFRGGQQ